MGDQEGDEQPKGAGPPPPPRQPDDNLKGYIERGNRERPSEVQTKHQRDRAKS